MIISIFNQAGGVAKTTTAVHLGYELGQLGHRVLIIDFDPQGNVGVFMGIDPWECKCSAYDCLMQEVDIRQAIVTLHGVDILPSNRTLGRAEMELVLANMREQKLKRAVEPVREHYDFILIDCPPSLGMLSYVALATSDQVLIPIHTEFKAYKGTDLLLETVAIVRKEVNPDLKIAGFLPTRYSKVKSQHQRVLAAINEQLKSLGSIYDPIPDAVAFADATENGVPLPLYSRDRKDVLTALTKLAKNIESLHPKYTKKERLVRA